MNTQSKLPRVTIIMPIRNEEAFIQRSLGAVLTQDYPHHCIEILIADGMSTDKTREIIKKLTIDNNNVKIIDNVRQIVSTGLNAALRQATGEIIIRVDGHTIIAADYVRQCVAELQRTQASNVGGKIVTVGETIFGQLVALATSSPFGIGGSKFHYSDKAQYVDTVYLGAYPRKVFDKVGLYDESLVRNQDYELNHRVRAAGGKIYFTPDIRSVYYGRATLAKFIKQYFQYGFWKVRVLNKHLDSLKFRHLVAPFFVLSLVVNALLSVYWLGRLLLGTILLSYTCTSLAASIHIARDSKGWHVLFLPVVFAILHLSWGVGFWWGILTLPFPPERVSGSGARR